MAMMAPTSSTTVGSRVLAEAAPAATETSCTLNGLRHSWWTWPGSCRLAARSSVDNIQAALGDHADGSVGDEEVERATGCGPVAQIGARDLQVRDLDGARVPALERPAGSESHGCGARPVHDHETHARLQLGNPLPSPEHPRHVSPDHKMELGCREAPLE